MELRRYPNRKLYRRGGYVSLATVAECVRQGEDISVHESRTGRDVTAYTLAHIVTREAERGRKYGPDAAHLLLQVVRLYGTTPATPERRRATIAELAELGEMDEEAA